TRRQSLVNKGPFTAEGPGDSRWSPRDRSQPKDLDTIIGHQGTVHSRRTWRQSLVTKGPYTAEGPGDSRWSPRDRSLL
ncbi:hypothetical protein LSAT2_003207, partial [Lamellibrachia satsuma]